jgi:hypothetical protein
MGILVRAVVWGFGFSLGAALYKQVSDKLGVDDNAREPRRDTTEENASDSGTPPEDAE